MRLAEVVMLMGAHCVSPVENSQLMTDAAKVQCAVAIEKDTETGTLKVTPEAAARDPKVTAAVARFGAAPVDSPAATSPRIVPAWVPAGSPTTDVKLPEDAQNGAPLTAPAIKPAPPEVRQDAAQSQPQHPEPAVAPSTPEKKVAVLTPPKQTTAPARTEAKKKQPVKVVAAPPKQAQCKTPGVLKWYRTMDGRKKFRCEKPASVSAPDQIY